MSRFSSLKDPGSKLDYQIDWSLWLESDTIAASEWTLPAGLQDYGDSFTDATATQWLAGGTVGAVYSIVNRITTAGGRIAERTIEVRMVDR
jgi:hypothetical protein